MVSKRNKSILKKLKRIATAVCVFLFWCIIPTSYFFLTLFHHFCGFQQHTNVYTYTLNFS